MFTIISAVRLDSKSVQIKTTMNAMDWSVRKANRTLGALYATDISNAVYRSYGIRANVPTVSDHDSAVDGVKTVTLTYDDCEWAMKLTNVIEVDFRSPVRFEGEVDCPVIHVDFVNKRVA